MPEKFITEIGTKIILSNDIAKPTPFWLISGWAVVMNTILVQKDSHTYTSLKTNGLLRKF